MLQIHSSETKSGVCVKRNGERKVEDGRDVPLTAKLPQPHSPPAADEATLPVTIGLTKVQGTGLGYTPHTHNSQLSFSRHSLEWQEQRSFDNSTPTD